MDYRILNITNGDAFNEYFLSRVGGEAVPFCEAMMDGNTILDIYSDKFINLRSEELGVSVEEYKSKAYLSETLHLHDYSVLNLWFGKDTFCQMNLLTLLAYLEQISYSGDVVLNYIDDETFEVIEANVNVELGIYRALYESILIFGRRGGELGVLVPKAIELCFDYHSDNGRLALAVRDNLGMNSTALIGLLLEISKEYGLSDIQAEKLIKKYGKGDTFMNEFICYSKCTTCQKAKNWLDDNGIGYEFRDIKTDNPTFDELTEWHAKSGMPLRKFFNTSGLLYKSLALKDKLPSMTEHEMLELLSSDGMLVKRPLLIGEDFVLVGFKEDEWKLKFNK